jgi:hypothetical protein
MTLSHVGTAHTVHRQVSDLFSGVAAGDLRLKPGESVAVDCGAEAEIVLESTQKDALKKNRD